MSHPLKTTEFRRPQGVSSILTPYCARNITVQGPWPSKSQSFKDSQSSSICYHGFRMLCQ